MTEAEEFLAALGRELAEEERLILCGFRGDPSAVGPTAWRPRPWKPGREVPFDPRDNVYVAVAAFGRAPDGSFRRRTDTFRSGRALMVDDVGTKVDPSVVERLRPSAIVETSPGNQQWWYLLDSPQRDVSRFDALVRAFIAGKLLGADPGMSGVNRVGRLPGFTNGKPANNGWICKLRHFDGDRRFEVEDLIREFGLSLVGRRYAEPVALVADRAERIRAFIQTRRRMAELGLLKRAGESDPSGWIEVSCPWLSEHTNSTDTGAAIREPADENGWYGAFRCHHGHCADRGWGDLTDALEEADVATIEAANRRAAEEAPWG